MNIEPIWRGIPKGVPQTLLTPAPLTTSQNVTCRALRHHIPMQSADMVGVAIKLKHTVRTNTNCNTLQKRPRDTAAGDRLTRSCLPGRKSHQPPTNTAKPQFSKGFACSSAAVHTMRTVQAARTHKATAHATHTHTKRQAGVAECLAPPATLGAPTGALGGWRQVADVTQDLRRLRSTLGAPTGALGGALPGAIFWERRRSPRQ